MNERLKELISQAFLDVFKEPLDWADSDVSQSEWVERFAELVRDDEREAIAALVEADGRVHPKAPDFVWRKTIAKLIRARGRQ
jgi:hypothetical protein